MPGEGWKRPTRFSPPPIHSGSAASFWKPPRSRPYSAAAAPAAAIAPAEVPPTFAKRYVRASSQSACGYTTPLVMPPFITTSQERVGSE